MRSILTIASSLTPDDPWWEDCTVPSEMTTDSIELVQLCMLSAAPLLACSGVAIAIRVPENPR